MCWLFLETVNPDVAVSLTSSPLEPCRIGLRKREPYGTAYQMKNELLLHEFRLCRLGDTRNGSLEAADPGTCTSTAQILESAGLIARNDEGLQMAPWDVIDAHNQSGCLILQGGSVLTPIRSVRNEL